MENLLGQLQQTTNFLKDKGITSPETGVVLGTGLHQLLSLIEVQQIIPYSEIPHYPVSTVEFHKGNLVYAKINDKYLLIMQGRFHAYEGYSMQQIVFPVRVMKWLGVRNLLLSNAAGGIKPDFKKGDLVLLKDHINLQSSNPLSGRNFEELGSRFPDMSEPYSVVLNNLLSGKAAESGLPL
jgi:purine-nucleoside phosphorylase